MNITAIKTSTMQGLQRQYNDATTIAAKAQAAFDSYNNKAQFFKDLYAQASNNYNAVSAQWTQFLSLKSSLKSLEETADDCNLVAQVTNEQIKRLVRKWEQVMQRTLEAADAITLASAYINKRRATNKIVSAEQVVDATQAASAAANTVTLVISALTSAVNTLTVAGQSVNSSNLTGMYIDLASAALLVPAKSPNAQVTVEHSPLEATLKALHDNLNNQKRAVGRALEDANAEMNVSKEALSMANAKVVTAQAALNAAQAALSA